MNCNTTHYRANSSSVPGDPTEVPIVGRIGRPGSPDLIVSGRVDRLAICATSVLIVDFKTNARPPATPHEAPPAYVAQLALYRRLLARLYPDRAIRAALLWTTTATLMELPAAMLDEAAAHVGI